jgi:hypothetical protein
MQVATRRQLEPDMVWWGGLGLAFMIVLAVNPVGFVGGGSDDWQYLNAARCWRELGPCLPFDHWQSRWPIIAPMAALIYLLGESRLTLGMCPFLASVASIVLLASIGNETFGKPVGWVAALLLLITPAFAIQALEPSVEPLELAFILAGTYACMRWIRSGRSAWALAAGLSLSVAIQVRETALVAAVFVGAYGFAKRRPNSASVFAALGSFTLPFLIEFLVFALETGDPFWRLRLAVRHTQLPSSELLGPIDTKNPPFFNRNYIAHWNFIPGVHVYWAIDGIINLFLNVIAGFSLSLVPILLVSSWRRIDRDSARKTLQLWAAAFTYICVLIYAFAIDPKARMFLPSIAAANLALAAVTYSLWRRGSVALASATWGTVAITGLICIYAYPRTVAVDRLAHTWLLSFPGQIEADVNTKRALTLVKGAAELPMVGSNRRLLLFESKRGCKAWIKSIHVTPASLSLIGEMKRSRFAHLYPKIGFSLCLFRYRSATASVKVGYILRRADIQWSLNKTRKL